MRITPLGPDTDSDIAHLGGKSMGLIRLLRAGFTVPEAWYIDATASLDPAAHQTILQEALPEWWERTGARQPGQLWAVRSSAVAEDLDDASFAGVYETTLGIGALPALRDAVDGCWSALDKTRATAYRGAHGPTDSPGIAVIIQRMVSPRVAGVLLTANPLNPFADEIVINTSWGLGEAVVSGHTDPDYIRLNRSTGAVLEHKVGSKHHEIVWDGGIVEREIDEARRDRPALTDEQIRDLWRIARAVEDRIGPRRDLEWAIADDVVYVLQDRPITTLPSENPTDIWSRRFGDEYLSECSLPLPGELMVPWITEAAFREMAVLQGRPDLAATQPVRLYQGYAYFSARYYAAGLRMLPRSMRNTAAGDWFPAQVDAWVEDEPWQPRLTVLALLAPLRDRQRSGINRNLVALERHCARIEHDIAGLLGQDYSALSPTEWQRQFRQVDELGREHFRVVRWGMTIYNTFLHAALAKLLHRWCRDDTGELYQHVIGGLDDTHTAELNTAVTSLATRCRTHHALSSSIASGEDYHSLRTRMGEAEFWQHYDAFLKRYGHRSASRDIASPRWFEEPEIILELIRARLRTDETAGSQAGEHLARRRRDDAERTMLAAAGRGPAGLLRRRILLRLTETVRHYTRYRENQRFYLDYLITHMRSLVLEQGRRLTEEHILANADDVFLLTRDEFSALADGAPAGPDLTVTVNRRRDDYAVYQRRTPATFLFDDVETELPAAVDEAGDLPDGALRGMGISRGTARGTARIATSLRDLGQVQAGDILVAPNIDPGWTSVFPLLAGLVIETGGMLAHGAILAREYGIPAVSGVRVAAAGLVSGTALAIDGNLGLIYLDPVPSPSPPA
ncbi:PEP-utilizing enzyme [Mycobacterium sp. CVI_P3]|uniref:PEP-utilizing enzyme n=1 Tax=Mycobacterium pinniadriaticum TaxID=2994102 RepID=A0ABT3SB02_9MYCO|nr:PEP/pyruvate-binding domain-containing protein [Mycobacterium pinniadriaticum]MCX2930248.1 PEP-utilizing enzyme [Mycobacterium pinniadriaticum]MCX2936690.1 PEP-utilizing enzyme [Mycobacterium pinniadriaticum]